MDFSFVHAKRSVFAEIHFADSHEFQITNLYVNFVIKGRRFWGHQRDSLEIRRSWKVLSCVLRAS